MTEQSVGCVNGQSSERLLECAPSARIGDCRVQANQKKNGGEETEMAVYVGIDVHKTLLPSSPHGRTTDT